MTVSERARGAVGRRLDAIQRALDGIEGVVVERQGDTLRVRGVQLARRSIDDMRLRLARFAR